MQEQDVENKIESILDMFPNEEEFQAKDFENSDVEHLLQCISTRKFEGFWTSDLEYLDWKNLIPKGWTLDRYYLAMNDLQDIFNHVSPFQKNCSEHFSSYSLFIKYNEEILDLNLTIGQGSDFSIIIAQTDVSTYLEWTDVLKLRKMSRYQQAVWYLQNVLKLKETDSDYNETLFKLGSTNNFFRV